MRKKIFSRLRSFFLFHCMLFINYILLISWQKNQLPDLLIFISLVISYVLTGISAFLVNDFYDKEVDSKAGKSNVVLGMNPYIVGFIVSIGFGVSFFLINRISEGASLLLCCQFAALLLYSHPLSRLKTHPIWGVITDSMYAHVIPLLLLYIVFQVEVLKLESFTFLLFNFCIGIRDIIIHQKTDELHDLKSEINSFVIRYKPIVNTATYFFEILATISLGVFLMTIVVYRNLEWYKLIVVPVYFVLVFMQIFKIQKSVESNYQIRCYLIISSYFIVNWIVKEKEYVLLVLLIHPYLLRFIKQGLIWIRDFIALLVNYLLFYFFKLFGRDLRKNPLYKKRN